jgi:SHS2 domain-containing protein
MPYEYLEDIAVADAAFKAWGQTLEEMFCAAAEAVMNVMVADLETIDGQQQLTLQVESDAIDMLLFELLQELIFYKDAEQLVLRVQELEIRRRNGLYTLRALAYGEQIDPGKHDLVVDVKAVTLHRFSVEQTSLGWETTVILDV